MADILIIEDNPANMRLSAMLLMAAGHSVMRATNAEDGMRVARIRHPALILMDIQLPGIDGLAATALLKRDPTTAAIPIIAVTSYGDVTGQGMSRGAGCDAYIPKPLHYRALYDAVDALLTPAVAPAPVA